MMIEDFFGITGFLLTLLGLLLLVLSNTWTAVTFAVLGIFLIMVAGLIQHERREARNEEYY